jgi:thioredoxin reductase
MHHRYILLRYSGAAVLERIETVVVGGGQAGLAMSYHLKRLGREHVVIERGRVGQSWRSERWDSLMFQFPNSSIQLPGYAYKTDDPDGYVPKDEIVRFIENYAALIDAPLVCGLRVVALRQNSASSRVLLETEQGPSFEAVNVVVATGPFHLPQMPVFAASMPVELFQVHSRDYRNPSELPAGAVLVVGSGASGSQIAEELHQAGRKVYLSMADLENTLAQGDAWFASLKKRMDEYAEKSGMTLSEESLIEEPVPALPPWSRPITELDLRSAGITSVVWCSGYRYDFTWVKLPILNDAGEPLHQRGVTQYPGLYFLGLRRTYAVSSALLAGVGNDAAFIADHIAARP